MSTQLNEEGATTSAGAAVLARMAVTAGAAVAAANGDTNNDNNRSSSDDDPEEYVVEAIRGRRKNPKTGTYEYLIKWENYSDSENTWEPEEHLKCPEVVRKFNENEKNKHKRRRRCDTNNSQATGGTPQPSKRARLENGRSIAGTSGQNGEQEIEEICIDDDLLSKIQKETSVTKNRKSADVSPTPIVVDQQISLRGFDRGLPIERILSAGSLRIVCIASSSSFMPCTIRSDSLQ